MSKQHKAPRRKGFPKVVKRGAVQVKIYCANHPRTAKGIVYVVVWHVGTLRKMTQFTDLARAEEEAALKADQLAAGRLDAAASVTVDDAEALRKARELCDGMPLLAALEEWRKARDLCGADLINAAQAWRDINGTTGRKEIAVSDVVEKFLTAKDRAGVDTGASYRNFLPRLKEKFSGPIHTVSALALTRWLHDTYAGPGKKEAHPVTFNTGRKRLVALWRWARQHNYLPAVAQTQAERIERMKEPREHIEIITVATFAKILALVRKQHPAYLAVAGLAGFCGLRRSELHAQKWKDVDLKAKSLIVTDAKLNTPADREVPLCDAAVAWLELCDRDGELVSPPWGIDRVRAFARDAGMALPENCFRHSFISYRIAQTGSKARAALEAGNSESIVDQHYRRPSRGIDGESWFALKP